MGRKGAGRAGVKVSLLPSLYSGCRPVHVPAHKIVLFAYCCTLTSTCVFAGQHFPKLNYNSVLHNGLSQVVKKSL